jgi:hypothetical protein
MCQNARDRCSWIVAMDKNGKINEAIAAYVRMVSKREKENENADK